MAIAANSQPTAEPPPNRSCATSGNSAREDHRDDVHAEGQQQHRLGDQEAQPVDDAAQPGGGPLGARLEDHRRDRRQPVGRPERDGEQHRVDRVGDHHAGPGRPDTEDQAGGQRPEHATGRGGRVGQRVRRRHEVARHDPRDDRLPGR